MSTPNHEPVAATATGFASGRQSIEWRDVREVLAYKLDLLTTDCLCIEFVTVRGTSVVVHEEQPGCDDLIRDLPLYLRGFPTAEMWWDSVVQPPFATNLTQLWQRKE